MAAMALKSAGVETIIRGFQASVNRRIFQTHELHQKDELKIGPPTWFLFFGRRTGLSYGLMKGEVPIFAWIAVALALVLSFCIDFANATKGGAIDLRNRITGVRLLEAGIDAYHYKWPADGPEEYCDVYNNPKVPVSKNDGDACAAHAPHAAGHFPVSRGAISLWLFTQWFLLLGTGWMWMRKCPIGMMRFLIAMAVAGFTYTAAWRLHAERGQTYVLLAFLFACWLVLASDAKGGNGFWAGCLAGFLIALRPPFVLLLPFLALHRRGQLLGAVAGMVLGFGLPLFMGTGVWGHYFEAMQEHSELYRNGIDPRPGPQSYPESIEGTPTDLVGNYVAIPYADFSAFALLRWLGFSPFPEQPLVAVAFVFLALVLAP